MNVSPKTAQRILYGAMAFFAILPIVLLFVLKKNPRFSSAPEVPVTVKVFTTLNAPDLNIGDDLATLQEIFKAYKSLHQAYPSGSNETIVQQLIKETPETTALLRPTDHAISTDGKLVDRWGTPFQFLTQSSGGIEISTAGPDRKFKTEDDFKVRLNP